MQAWEEGRLSDDIIAEQRKVEAAELIIFQVRGQRQEAVVRSRDLALTELDCVCVCASAPAVPAVLVQCSGHHEGLVRQSADTRLRLLTGGHVQQRHF